MSKVQQLRASVKQRLTAAVEEIFGLFERTIAEYEEEIDRQRRLLEDVLKPEIQINKADVPQLLVCKEEVPPEQQDWSPSLDQEDPEPPHIKEEQEELWTSQEGERLQGPEEADITEFPFTPVPVKSEDDEEKPQSSQLHQSQTEENREPEPLASSSTEQMKTEADGEDCGVSEPARNLDPASHLQPTSDGKTSDSSELETEDSDGDWKETREPQSGLNTLKSTKKQKVEVQRSMKCSYELKPSNQSSSHVCCKVCGNYFQTKLSFMRHVKVHSSDCGLCGKHLEPTESLKHHLEAHRSCGVCGEMFTSTGDLETHMRNHMRPHNCKDCGKGFASKSSLNAHMRCHTGERPFNCSVCGKSFGQKAHLQAHMKLHTGEKPFSCSVCGKVFHHKGNLKKHARVHTGEKPYSCLVCGKRFNEKGNLNKHTRLHIGETVQFPCFGEKI